MIQQFLVLINILYKKKKKDQEDNRLLLSGMLIHAADFFGAVKPFKIAEVWS